MQGWFFKHLVLKFGELDLLENLLEEHATHPLLKVDKVSEVQTEERSYPIYKLTIGKETHAERQLGIVAGVHGLEKIGTRLLLYYLDSFLKRLNWNTSLQKNFENMKMVIVPIANPGGMAINCRSTPEGIDMMRNAPIESSEPVPWLAGGHRISNKLPWYRGPVGKGLCHENKILSEVMRQELFQSKLSLSLDLHSGFGGRDRLWYPFAKTQKPIDREELFLNFKSTMRSIHPHHVYKVESQSAAYCTHGDFWDYLYERHREEQPDHIFLPWTLEMGSWLWLKKNPLKLFHRLGIFNPTLKHRHRRILRRHYNLLEFFFEYTANVDYQSWKTGSY